MSNIKCPNSDQIFQPADLTSQLLRAARALVGLTAEQLAGKALVGVATIRRAELDDGPVQMTTANAARVIDALRAEGLVFLAAGTSVGPGLRYTSDHVATARRRRAPGPVSSRVEASDT